MCMGQKDRRDVHNEISKTKYGLQNIFDSMCFRPQNGFD